MPRRSGHGSEDSPAPRRTSARIAAAQVASPAKSPIKSPRRKRQSTDPSKTASEDTESQQSQIKSDSSMEELNGIETSSSKDRESVTDSQEIPPKKTKLDRETDEENHLIDAEVDKKSDVTAAVTEAPDPIHAEPVGFEVVEKSDVPLADSEEVKAAVDVQGEDGQLLVGFVQVDKDEIPSATSVEIKQITPTEEPNDQMEVTTAGDTSAATPPDSIVVTSVNGDSHNHVHSPGDSADVAENVDIDVQNKVCAASDVSAQPTSNLAAGDVSTDAINPEAVH
ncbi:hypothetical protein EG68_11372 [Paragonimus skrjabini miyazakii]|uniref:Uncharacterized protein n=1 Tax=Paragonimus skrjabini miyazakii TaxID=59628 RepID=A0A8S9YEK0_9TREM|nr:hypothetical protein EG68_11372 [Paragonimus skrjabini miyazakii]